MNYIVCVMLESFLWINIRVVTCIVKRLTDIFREESNIFIIQRNGVVNFESKVSTLRIYYFFNFRFLKFLIFIYIWIHITLRTIFEEISKEGFRLMRSSNTEGLSHWKEASKKRKVIEVASKGKKMEIKSHVMSLVLRNGGYTVSNPRFLCRLVSLVLYGPWIGPSFKCQRVYPRDCHELLLKQPDRGKNR